MEPVNRFIVKFLLTQNLMRHFLFATIHPGIQPRRHLQSQGFFAIQIDPKYSRGNTAQNDKSNAGQPVGE